MGLTVTRLCVALLSMALIGLAAGQSPVSVRFAGGVTTNYGTVEVTMSDGSVGRICDAGFDNNGASVICAMMGYRDISGFKVALPAVNTGSTTFVMAVTSCPDFLPGSTTTWNLNTACRYVVAIPSTGCSSRANDVSVVCNGALTTAAGSLTTVAPDLATVAPIFCNSSVTNLRLEPGPDEGIVLIQNGSAGGTNFGTVCASGFGVNEATTICRMLCQNATTNAIGTTGRYLNVSSTYPVMLSGLACPAGATSINDCSRNGWGVTGGCTSTSAVTVRCTPISLTPPNVPHPTAFCRDYHALVYFNISEIASSSLLSLYGTYNAATCNFTTGQNGTTVWAIMPYIGCNSVQTTNATHVFYTSNLYKNVTLVDGVYIDSPYIIPVSCGIAKAGAVSAAMVPDARTVTPITGADTYASEVRLFQTYSAGTFQTEIAPGDKLIVGSKIYSRIQVTSPLNIRLTVRSCWASDKNDGTGSRYFMVQNKCASTGNSIFRVDAKTVGVNFMVISFTGTPSTQVYVFCDVIICTETDTDPRCQQVCGTMVRRRKRRSVNDDELEGHPHNGPFRIVAADSLDATSAAGRTTTMATFSTISVAAFVAVIVFGQQV